MFHEEGKEPGIWDISTLVPVVKMGAEKYGMMNYRHGTEVSRRLNSAFRHLDKLIHHDEKWDQESGYSHRLHIAANLLIICSWFTLPNWTELNDIPSLQEDKEIPELPEGVEIIYHGDIEDLPDIEEEKE